VAEARITFVGSLDISTVTSFTEQVQAAAQGSDRIVVDCTEMEFLDSTGVRGLVVLKQQMASMGKQLVFEGFGSHIIDILDILGIREVVIDA